ncbi:calpain-12 isoform X2 [Panthera pardus]|uniref:Calpain-12 isoform X2 n=1 Tax=Panthera pardus TaxID=9691 RepID=A0A9W2VTI2_PANPR|nr:calpain-12 isoform X2 [Panthera pardus]
MACGSRRVTIQLVDEEAGPGTRGPKPFRGQRYEAIRAACLDEGILFRDPYFPAGPDALGYDELGPDSEKAKGVEWLRPHEFCAEPQFICEDMSRTDVCQGRLGNCWFLAAAASLTLYPRLLCRVVPPGQGFQGGYAGVFHFQLWQFGRWVDVVVDDRLPVRDGKLIFVRSDQRNEFWAPLLEKAYAKLHGSYEVMRGGHMNEAFVDFTGGVGEVLYLRRDTPGLFSALRHALAKESLVGATALSDRGEYRTEDGLVKGHAYSVTGTYKVSLGFTKVRLLRLRNPWGRVEWTGAWSDSCPRWDALPAECRDALLVKKEDGEFWMGLEDFVRCFNTVQVCSLSPEVLGPSPAGGGWHIHTFQGRWVRGFNSGGSQPGNETFWTNPQFRLTLLEPDEEEDDDEEGPWGGWGAAGAWGPARGGRIPKCTVLLSLIQRNRRRLRAQGLTYLTVGFHVFQVGPQGLAEAAGDRRGGAGKAEGVEVRDRTEPRAWGWGGGERGAGKVAQGADRSRVQRGSQMGWPGQGLRGRGVMMAEWEEEGGVGGSDSPRSSSLQIPEELLGLWDSPRSRALLPGLLRADRSPFCARRDVSRRCRLRPGHYLVVPSAARAGDEADFTLRVFSERRHTAVEIDDVISADLHALLVPYVPLELGLEQLFQELAGEEEALSAPQLQTLLSIALEPARSHARTPREIGLRTCEQLLRCFGATFDKFDEDASGTMNSYELRLALNAAGFHLNNQLTQALTSRYRDSRLQVDFERFVSCAAQLTCIFRHCSRQLEGGEGVVCLTRRQHLRPEAEEPPGPPPPLPGTRGRCSGAMRRFGASPREPARLERLLAPVPTSRAMLATQLPALLCALLSPSGRGDGDGTLLVQATRLSARSLARAGPR